MINHPVLARRLLFTADIALRAMQCVGVAFLLAQPLLMAGTPIGVVVAITAVALTPILTKILQYRWNAFDQPDRRSVASHGLSGCYGEFYRNLSVYRCDDLYVAIWVDISDIGIDPYA